MKTQTLFDTWMLSGILLMATGQDIFPQYNNLEWDCGCTPDTVLSTELGNSITFEDTSLKVGILLVQFADWQTNWNARGGVGYDTSDISIANTIYNKYRWSHVWDMYFSVGTYRDANPDFPTIHPDAHSHGIAVYGSFTDYWWEVSHKNLRIDAAETHPSYDGHYRTGIVNNVDTATGIIQWVTLDHTVSYYVDTLGRNSWAIINDAHTKAHQLFADPNVPDSLRLHKDVENPAHFDKIIIVYAGVVKGPGTVNALGGRYAICNEVDPKGGGWPLSQTPGMAGINCKAHEFGHLLYFEDLHAMGSGRSNGVGYFSHMGRGSAWDRPRLGTFPRHIDPWHKLRAGWMDYVAITSDTANFYVANVEDTSGTTLPKVAILMNAGNQQNPDWRIDDYFILENRATIGFDKRLIYPDDPNGPPEDPAFLGGMVLWYHSPQTLPNQLNLQVIEADADSILHPNGGISDSSDVGSPHDFFPGLDTVTAVDDYGYPSLRLANGQFSHFALKGISYSQQNRMLTIDTVLTRSDFLIIDQNTTWSGVKSINRDVLIKSGATLTVSAGSEVIVSRNGTDLVSIVVESSATLNVQGTPLQPVTFRSPFSSSPEDWEGIFVEGGADLNIENLYVSNAKKPIVAQNLNSKTILGLHVANCLSMPLLSGTFLVFIDCSFQSIVEGPMILGGKFHVLNSIFRKTSIVITSSQSVSLMSGCKFMSGSSLSLWNSHLHLTKSDFDSSSIRIWREDHSVIDYNIFIGRSSQGYGIQIYHTKLDEEVNQPLIKNNVFVDYGMGIQTTFPDGGFPADTAEPVLTNNVLYRNLQTSNDWSSLQGAGTALYNCIYNNDTTSYTPPAGNLEIDPQFVNATAGDFRLKYSSPCIDAGNPNDDYSLEPEPNGGRINMGHHGNTGYAAGTFNIIASANLTANTTWQNYVIVTNDISTSGHNLTVSPGTQVYFDSAKTVTIDGDFTSNGIITNPIYYRAYRANDLMGGLVITGDDDVSIQYSTFTKAGNALTFSEFIPYDRAILQNLTFLHNTRGIYASKSDITVENSTVDSNQTGLTSQEATVTVTGSTFRHNSAQGAYVFESTAYFDDCTFENNGLRGVYYQYSSDGSFIGNTVRFNGGSTEDTDLKAGLVFYQSSPAVEGNHIARNYGPGILSLAGSYPVMTLNGVLHNRPSHPSDENNAEILAKDFAVPVIDQGHNDIYDSLGGYYLYHDHEGQSEVMYATENYWGTVNGELIADAIYPTGGFIFEPFDESPNTGFSKRLADSLSENLFRQAYQFERDENYPAAMVRYDSILSLYAGTFYALAALDRNFVVKRKTGVPAADLRSYVNPWTGHDEEPLGRLAKRLSLRCLTLDEQYAEAIDNHELWQATTTLVNDSIYSELDILTNGLLGSGRSLGKAIGTTSAMPMSASLSGYERQSEEIIKGLFRSGSSRRTGSLPAVFGLSQNYPNPFNPVTTLKYQLPYDSRVTLKVYNILGQEVKTLVNKSQPGGYYTVPWDGKNRAGHRVSSGIYIYRIVATSGDQKFIKSKKMTLIK